MLEADNPRITPQNGEVYKLQCHGCNHTVEIPTVGAWGCPMCETPLTALDWGALHREAARESGR
jgi:hypothetical protein